MFLALFCILELIIVVSSWFLCNLKIGKLEFFVGERSDCLVLVVFLKHVFFCTIHLVTKCCAGPYFLLAEQKFLVFLH
jgi:hypothetical protein